MAVSEVKILCSGQTHQQKDLSPNDLHLASLIEFLGIYPRTIHFKKYLDGTVSTRGAKGEVLALSYPTLADIHSDSGSFKKFASLVEDRVSYLFLYGISENRKIITALSALCGGNVKSIKRVGPSENEYRITHEHRDVCQQFSGLSFGPVKTDTDYTITLETTGKNTDDFITINEKPLFARIKRGNCQIFLSATADILDIRCSTPYHLNRRNVFSRLVPPMMFIKYVSQDYCWHNDSPRGCMIIDDPLMKKKYGYLDYNLLLQAMDDANFHTSIAYIPWNYKRSDPEVIRLFKERPDRFSICVHGCDHTASEFGSEDIEELDFLVRRATLKMELHEKKTGLKCDRIMVFPHDVFSVKALKVLKKNGYLGAANAVALPSGNSETPRIESLVQPASVQYHDFPLYQRLGDFRLESIALQLFLGRPVITFIHHDDLKKGYAYLSDFFKQINELDDRIVWENLGKIIENTYFIRRVDDQRLEVRMYSSRVSITNRAKIPQNYTVTKSEDDFYIDSVLVDGNEVEYSRKNGMLTFSTEILPGGTAEIGINYRYPLEDVSFRSSLPHEIRVFIRRRISEFRDRFLSQHPGLLSLFNFIKGSRD